MTVHVDDMAAASRPMNFRRMRELRLDRLQFCARLLVSGPSRFVFGREFALPILRAALRFAVRPYPTRRRKLTGKLVESDRQMSRVRPS